MSKSVFNGIEPSLLWERFYEISTVPRPSKKEEKIRNYLKEFSKKNKIEFKEDNTGNIVMLIPATQGYESSQTIVLQSHVDMVCEKNRDKDHDFDNDPLTLIIDGDWLKADGTTLGSDNGIGMAASLAAATDNSIKHGPLELLFTVDEETGLTGANTLQPGFITGKILLNMDSEEDGAFYVGCAGGIDSMGIFEIAYEDLSNGLIAINIFVKGLKGGHSGLDISTGKANAIKILARTLNQIKQVNFKIADLSGGSKRNAIPREAEATLLINAEDRLKLESIIEEFKSHIKNEVKIVEPDLDIEISISDKSFTKNFTDEFTSKIIDVLLGLPHGVISMSMEIPELVETSTNLATITIDEGKLKIGTSQRSSVESSKMYIAESVRAVFKLACAEVLAGDGYPGWKPNLDSDVLKISKKVFQSMFNALPEIKAIHAGLECGILGDKYPGLDMISFGPTIQGAHSPDERVSISTVDKFYALLKSILVELAEKSK